MAFEHHPGLHALWLANQKAPQESSVRMTEEGSADQEQVTGQVTEQVTGQVPPKTRRKKSARVFGEDS